MRTRRVARRPGRGRASRAAPSCPRPPGSLEKLEHLARSSSNPGCRSARRPRAAADRSPARGRWPPAGAARRTPPKAACPRARRCRPGRAGAARAPALPRRAVEPGKIHRHHDVLRAGQHRQQLEELEHDAHGPPAPRSDLIFAHRWMALSPTQISPAGRPVDAGDHVDKRRFAGARLAQDGQELARLHVELDALQRVEVAGRRACTPCRRPIRLRPDHVASARDCRSSHSYANTSRTVRRTALRAGARLATAAMASRMKNQTTAPSERVMVLQRNLDQRQRPTGR